MLQPGDAAGDREVLDLRGGARTLREFRRRSHVMLIWDPSAGGGERAAWLERRTTESQHWTWLQAEIVTPAAAAADLGPGNYLISRWGKIIAVHPPGAWDLEKVDRDFLTFEAQDSCDACVS